MKVRPGVPVRPHLLYERRQLRAGLMSVAGVDEVGRGSWAGPLVAAAVVLPLGRRGLLRTLECVADSKGLSPSEREAAFRAIVDSGAGVAIGWATHQAVDRDGLGSANRAALCRAVRRLPSSPHSVLVDHFHLPECELPQVAITHGDSICLSIAAASVVAKVVRDRWMRFADMRYPGYGFGAHKGYGTAQHRRALETLGPSPLHRRSFAPVAHYLQCREP